MRSTRCVITAELNRRPSRDADYAAENRALTVLTKQMAQDPGGVLQKLAELVVELCRADSSAVSILEPGPENAVFRWHAAAGAFKSNVNRTMPRDGSPCGTAVSRDDILLFKEPERCFPALRVFEPRIYENLLAPWHVNGEAVGTVWAIRHTPEHSFDAEDARLLQSVSPFAAAAYQITSALEQAKTSGKELEQGVAHRTRALSEALENLRASEERYRLIVENALDYAILTVDVEGRIANWSPGAAAVFGWTAAEIIGKPNSILFVAEDRARGVAAQEYAQARDTGMAPDVRWHVRKDGSPVFIEGTARALWDDNGEFRGLFKIGRDATERKRAEQELRDSEERFRLFVENVREYALVQTDPEGKVTSWNPGAERLFGYTSPEMLGRNFS
ncbi:MAG: PAS domain S-box protein, partial [Acidobacteriaceae bacterium]|nr:PAS domain S-box protein [Acidobacteriaceae bacterium]